MNEVQRAIHIRTGQRAAADAIDQWLAQYGVTMTPFGDVYAACAHLLQQYDDVPDLVFVGADWLVDDELTIIAYVHQIWPRAGVVVYGSGAVTPRVDMLPMMHAVRVEDMLPAMLAEPPRALLEHVLERAAALTPQARTISQMRASTEVPADHPADAEGEPSADDPPPAADDLPAKDDESAGNAHSGVDLDELLSQLSADELSALLDETEEGRRR